MITAELIASTVNSLLATHLISPEMPAFYLWARADRAIVSINPGNLKSLDAVYSDRFAHHLSTILGGVRVEKANSHGIFYQVGYTPLPPPALHSRPLDFTQQTSPTMLPIGMTRSGPFWLDLFDLQSVLVGGTRRMGKTRFLHGWIQALLHSGAADLWLYDGKSGLEFGRYANQPGVRLIDDLTPALAELLQLADERSRAFGLVSATSMAEYNERIPQDQRLRPVVLFVDEAALVTAEALDPLARLVAWSGAHGIFPVLATQRTGVDQVPALIKTNLATRISFPVPGMADSRVILDRPGAEQLPKVPGRLVMVWDGRLVQAQAYQVELPGAPAITPRDLDLAAWIRAQHAGHISIQRLVAGRQMSEWTARQLIDAWQSRGWLIGGGNGVSRRLSPTLEALLPQGLKVPQGSQGSLSVEV